jgi:NAD(P)-dependent dehydrogenase (short-subunit alcohol dehydrogenase family)
VDCVSARNCLVTGASSGIGRAVAVRLAAAGHRVALTARSAPEAVSGTSLSLPADITAPGAVNGLFGEVERAWGPVEVLVLSAGAGSAAPLARVTDDDWQHMLDLNLTAPFRCVRRAVPAMVERGWGRVVVIASVAAKRGAPYIAAYAAAKHGVLGLVRSAAAELAGTGVTVNAVCPGYVDTPMTERTVADIVARTGRDPGDVRGFLMRQQPIGRLITPDEVADAVELCVRSDAITGQGIDVDGGTLQS